MIKVFYDSIITVIDKLIKYFYFVLLKKIFDAKQFRHFFINQII